MPIKYRISIALNVFDNALHTLFKVNQLVTETVEMKVIPNILRLTK